MLNRPPRVARQTIAGVRRLRVKWEVSAHSWQKSRPFQCCSAASHTRVAGETFMDTARSGRGLYICLQTTLAHAIYPRMPDTCGLFFLAGARQVRVDRRRYGGGPLATASGVATGSKRRALR